MSTDEFNDNNSITKRPRKRKYLLLLFSIILLGSLGTGAFLLLKDDASTNVKRMEETRVKRGDIVSTIKVTGEAFFDEEIELNFLIGGKVSKIYVKEGDVVKKDDLLATIDAADLQRQLKRAVIERDNAKLTHARMERTPERVDVVTAQNSLFAAQTALIRCVSGLEDQ